MVRAILAAIVLLTVVPAAAMAGSLVPVPGYYCVDTPVTMPAGAWFGGFDVLPNGNFVISDGYSVREITPAGVDVNTLYTYPAYVYASFVKYNPANNRVYFGETSSHSIMSVPVLGGTASLVANVQFNYDLDFWAGTPYVVAGNTLYAIDESTGQTDAIATAGIVSGPMVFDGAGNLIYGTGNPNWPPTTGDQNIYMWSASQVAGAIGPSVLDVSDATVLAAGVNAPTGFAINGLGQLIYTDSQVSPAVLRIVQGGTAQLYTTTSVPGAFPWATVIRYNPATDGLSVAVSWLDSNWNAHTVISTLLPVPEPSTAAALAGLMCFAAPTSLLRRRINRSRQ